MKLAISKKTYKGSIVTNLEAEGLVYTHRVVDVKETYRSEYGVQYSDVWGGTWFVPQKSGETRCTVGDMDKWS